MMFACVSVFCVERGRREGEEERGVVVRCAVLCVWTLCLWCDVCVWCVRCDVIVSDCVCACVHVFMCVC